MKAWTQWIGQASFLKLGLLLAFIPFLPLLFKTTGGLDAINHPWMINYCARNLLRHGSFPLLFNTHDLIGMAQPVFYGTLFMPVMALSSLVFDANITLRLFAFLLWVGEFALVGSTLMKLTRDRTFSIAVACLTIWTIYPLTNVYQRSAWPEFFATGLLTCGCVSLIRALTAETSKESRFWSNFSILFLCGTAGTHPITATFGALFFVALCLLATLLLPAAGKSLSLSHLLPLVFALISMAPWVYATSLYHKDLRIVNGSFYVVSYPKTYDTWPMRLLPVPMPMRYFAEGLKQETVWVKHQDAQINSPLLLVLLSFLISAVRSRRRDWRFLMLAACGLASALWIVNLSLDPGKLGQMGLMFNSLQFSYRLVTYANLAILCGVLLCAAAHFASPGNEKYKRWLHPAVVTLCLSLSGAGLLLKMSFTRSSEPLDYRHLLAGQRDDENLLQMPSENTGGGDYCLPDLVPSLSADPQNRLTFPLGQGAEFGNVQLLDVPSSGNFTALTNVLIFPWNKIMQSDRALEGVHLLAWQDQLAVNQIPQAGLRYRSEVDPTWRALRTVSLPTFFAWLGCSLLWAGKLALQSRHSRGDLGQAAAG